MFGNHHFFIHKPTLVIGIGGTGIKTIIHVKKILQDQQPDGKLPSYIQFLGLDTQIKPEEINDIGSWISSYARRNINDYQGLCKLDVNREYISLGGNTEPWVCGEDSFWNDSTATNWFDKKYFCGHPDNKQLLNIDMGTRMYPQLGRLALFHSLRQGQSSILYHMLRNKINALDNDNIQIIICCSLAGGTGTGIYIDIAHLCKKISEEQRKGESTYGMLVLPNAFKWTAPVVVDDSMLGRTTASLRQLQRFISVHSHDIGFPMHYVESDNDPVLAARTSGSIFNLVFMFDERYRHPNRMSSPNPLQVSIEHGIAPTVASWILAMVDPNSQERVAPGFANRAGLLGNMLLEDKSLVPTVTGSVGSFSYVLPIAAIIERWTNQLVREVNWQMATSKENDNENLAAFGDLSAIDVENKVRGYWENQSTAVGKDVSKIGPSCKKDGDETIIIDQIMNRNVSDWYWILKYPESSQETERTEEDRRQYQYIFKEMDEDVYFFKNRGFLRNPLKGALVQEESPRHHTNNPIAAAKALVRNCDNNEQRKLNIWRQEIEKSTDSQLAVYCQELLKFTKITLNGFDEDTQKDDPYKAREYRSGKLVYLFWCIEEQTKHLECTRKLLLKAQETRNGELHPIRLKLDPHFDGGLYNAMQRSAKKQKAYLEARQILFDYKRWDLCCEVEADLVDKMHSYTRVLRDKLNEYVKMFSPVSGNEKYSITYRNTIIKNERKSSEASDPTRRIVNDPEWENALYYNYTNETQDNPSAVDNVLHDIKWEVEDIPLDLPVGKSFKIPEIKLKIDGHEPDSDRPFSSILHTRCRSEFDDAWDDLTIVDYLMYRWDGSTVERSPQAFGQILLDHCDVMLRLPTSGPAPYLLTYLLVPENTYEGGARTWLDQVSVYLTSHTFSDAAHSGVVRHFDRSTLTYIPIVDLVLINELPAYKEGLRKYMEFSNIPRRLLHTFPAEQNAMIFDKVQDDHIKLVPPRLVSILNDMVRFELFVLAIALGFLRDHLVTDGPDEVGWVKQVEILPRIIDQDGEVIKDDVEFDQDGSPTRGEFKKDIFNRPVRMPYVWVLTDPWGFHDQQAPYIHAAETFCLEKYGYNHENNQDKSMTEMHQRLEEAIQIRIDALLKENYIPMWEKRHGLEFGIKAAGLPQGEARNEKLLSAIRIDLYQELSEKLNTYVKNIDERRDSFDEITFADEVRFIELILNALGMWIKKESAHF